MRIACQMLAEADSCLPDGGGQHTKNLWKTCKREECSHGMGHGRCPGVILGSGTSDPEAFFVVTLKIIFFPAISILCRPCSG